jgi:hypothetical protein
MRRPYRFDCQVQISGAKFLRVRGAAGVASRLNPVAVFDVKSSRQPISNLLQEFYEY